MLDQTPASPPDVWAGPAGVYTFTVAGREAWDVALDGQPLGTLIDLVVATGNRWTIRVPGNEVAGVGASWPTWEDALIELAEFRGTLAS
jgi:hypothetical protein